MDLNALARQVDEMLGQPPGTTTPEDVERILNVSRTPAKPGLAERRAATIQSRAALQSQAARQAPAQAPAGTLPVFPQPQDDDVVEVEVEGLGTLQFPNTMSQDEIKAVLDRTVGPNRPRSDTPLLQDLLGTVTEPLSKLVSPSQPGTPPPAPTPTGDPTRDMLSRAEHGLAARRAQREPDLGKNIAGVELATAPWAAAGRATEHAWERGASAVTGQPRQSTWPSTIAGVVGGALGPSLIARGLGRALGRGAATVTPPRPRLRVDRHGFISGVPDDPLRGVPATKLVLGRPLISPEGPLGPGASLVGRFLSPLYSRMEALGPEGFEAARLLRQVAVSTSQRTARDIQPLVDEIKRLSKPQRRQLFRHLHKNEPAADPAVAQAASAYAAVFGPQGLMPRQMTEAGMQMFRRIGARRATAGPFQARQQFYPLEYPGSFKSKLAESTKFREQLAEELVRTGQAPSLAAAHRTIKQFIEGRAFGRERPSPGEYVREIELPGFIKDPAEAVMLRGWRTSKRLAEIEHLGPKDAKLEALVERLRAANPERASRLETYIDIALGGQRGLGASADRRLGRLARTAKSAQAFFKLPLAIIPNLSQTAWTAFRTDAASTLSALAKLMFRRKETIRAARELGAYTDITARQLMQEYASDFGSRALDLVLRPFNVVERFNRIIAANAGIAWAKRMEAALQRYQPKQAPRLYRELRRLGFADDEARTALTARRFSPDQHKRIALEIVDQTQFIPSRGGRSEFFNSELGGVLGQFKTFSMNLARMLNRVVLDELRAGNPAPAIRLLFYAGVPMQLAGELVANTRALITGRTRPSVESEWVLRMIENFTSVGALGIATDAVISLTSGRSLVDFMQGPTVDDLTRLVGRITGMLGADTPEELQRQGVELARFGLRRAVPYLGPALTTHTLPPTVPAPGYIQNPTVPDLLGLSQRAHMEARTRKQDRKLDQRERWLRYRQGLSR